MQRGICNREFYGVLVYEFKKIIGNPNFSDLFNPMIVEGYAALGSCTAVVQASDSMTASM